MKPTASNKSVRLLIAKDGTTADLLLPAEANREELAYEWCLVMLQEASVSVTPEVTARVKELLEAYTAGTEQRGEIARGVPVTHGEDGYIEWEPGLEPESVQTEEPPATEEDEQAVEDAPAAAVCFYSRCAFTMVSKGQRLGRVVPPTLGKEGRDVRGQTIPSRDGKPYKLKDDESVSVSDSGVMTAETDGVLSRSGIRVSVQQFLEIPGYVDFSTGHIDFEGDAKIRKGVRDLFEVRATGNIEIGQLIEAATIEAGGDIFATGGIAGRERGRIAAKGDITIRYLDSSEVSVGGVLRFEREMLNCKAQVMGSIESPGGSIIGGEVRVVGRMVIATLGSNSQVATTIYAGSVPLLESKLEALEKLVKEMQAKEDSIKRELARMAEPGRVLSPDDRERVKQLASDLQNMEAHRARCESSQRELAERIQSIRFVDISVEKMLHAGVRVVFGNQIFKISKDLKGPVRILLDKQGDMVYRIGTRGRNLPLRLISEVRAAAA